MEKTMTIKEMPAQERPRERCLSLGSGALSTAELLAILLRTGIRGKTALDLAREVLSRFGSLRELSKAAPSEVATLSGIGPARAVQVMAALELARRFTEEDLLEIEHLSGSEEAYRYLKPRLRDLPQEVFAVLFLNQKHGVLAYKELFRGSVASSTVHPREVIREVIRQNAAAVILAHNHPSGHVRPSPDDLKLTEELISLLSHLEVRVVDHIIVGGNGHFSFAREGLLSR